MRTILFLTEKEATQYAEENRLEETSRCIEFDERTSSLEYYDEDGFYSVVGTWSGESSAAVYTDGDEETALGWWYNDGEGPTIVVDGEEITDEDVIGGVYTTNGDAAEITPDAAQEILIAFKKAGKCESDILTLENTDEDDFIAEAEKLDFTEEVLPRRIFSANNGQYMFVLTKDNPYFDRK